MLPRRDLSAVAGRRRRPARTERHRLRKKRPGRRCDAGKREQPFAAVPQRVRVPHLRYVARDRVIEDLRQLCEPQRVREPRARRAVELVSFRRARAPHDYEVRAVVDRLREPEQVVARGMRAIHGRLRRRRPAEHRLHLGARLVVQRERLEARCEVEVAVDDDERVGVDLRMRRDQLGVREAGVRDADQHQLGDLHAFRAKLGGQLRDLREIPRVAPVLEPARASSGAFVAVGADTVVELAQPISSTGLEARDMERNGEGIHALTFKTKDIGRAADFLKSKGLRSEPGEPDSFVLGQEAAFGMVIRFTQTGLRNDSRAN